MLHVHHMNEDDDEIMTLKIYIYIYICAIYEQDDDIMLNVSFMCITQTFVPWYHNTVIRILC
jgi:hypothetical protein